jgi:DNA-binding transcriptional regulator YiaG
MKQRALTWRLGMLALLALLFAACGMTVLGRAKQSASASYSVYESVTPQVVTEIRTLVDKSRAGTLTEPERQRLRQLDELRKVLDDYAAAHNLFVEAVKTWEQTGQEPSNAPLLENQILRLINRALDLASELKVPIPAGLR